MVVEVARGVQIREDLAVSVVVVVHLHQVLAGKVGRLAAVALLVLRTGMAEMAGQPREVAQE